MLDALADRRAPFDGSRRDTLVVGTLCTLATFAAPAAGLLLLGYAVRAVRRRARGDGLPAFDDWPALAADGLRAAAVAAPFHLPAVAVVAAVGPGRLLRAPSSLASLGHYALSPDYVGVAAVAVAALLELAAWHLSAAALVAFVRVDAASVRCAVRAATVAGDRRFARAFGVALGAAVAGGLLRTLAALVPLVGVPLGAFVSFGALVVAASALADAVPAADRSPGSEARDDAGVETAGRLTDV